MITDINSEDRLVQQTFAEHLRDRLGWESRLCLQHRVFRTEWNSRALVRAGCGVGA